MGKFEPVPIKKLASGRHRSIHSPGPVINIVEIMASHFVKDGVLYRHDQVASVESVRIAMGNHWVIGKSPKEVHGILSASYAAGASSYDISGWDRSLPMDVIESFFRHFVGSKGVTLGTGYCGRGIFQVGCSFYRLPSQYAAWASGSMKTLFGNTMIHCALLRTLDVGSFHVQGDDCIFSCCIDGPKLISRIAEVGLEARDFKTGDEVEFCKIRPSADRLEFEMADIYDKMSLRRFEDNDDGLYVAIAAFVSWEVRTSNLHLPSFFYQDHVLPRLLASLDKFKHWFDMEELHPFDVEPLAVSAS